MIRGAYTLSNFLEGTGTNLRLTLNPPFATEHNINYTPTQTPSTLAEGYSVFGASTANNIDYTAYPFASGVPTSARPFPISGISQFNTSSETR